MKMIDDEEKLALLGFADPKHSLVWYRKEYENLPTILERFIVETLNKYGVFPSDAKGEDKKILCHKYYFMIEHISGKYVLKINNTDRMEVSEERVFDHAGEAAKFLINSSYTTGGSVNQYW